MSDNKKRWIFACVLWLILAAMLLLFHILSSQNGITTSKLSNSIARVICSVIYNKPTASDIITVNRIIRKAAHLIVFFLLGAFSIMTVRVTFYNILKRLHVYAIVAFVNVFYAFFDEWQKQFIAGRHNSFSEALLNVAGSIAGIAVGGYIFYRMAGRKNR